MLSSVSSHADRELLDVAVEVGRRRRRVSAPRRAEAALNRLQHPDVSAPSMSGRPLLAALRRAARRRGRDRRAARRSTTPSSPFPTSARAVVLAAVAGLGATPTRARRHPDRAERRSSSCTIWRRFVGAMTPSSSSRPGRRSPSSGSRRRSRRWAGASGRCGGCAMPASEPAQVRRRHPSRRRPGQGALAAARPRGRGRRRRSSSARGDELDPDESRRAPRPRRVPPRVPGRAPRRVRRAGRHRRRLPLDRRDRASGSTASATRSSG